MSKPIVIIGAGLAGTTLAWHLHWRGLPFLIIDRHERVTSSRIAAGLINPITGQRLALSWRFHEFDAYARTFYRQVEHELGKLILIERPMVRLFQNDLERERYERKAGTFGPLVQSIQPPLNPDDFHAMGGGFELPLTTALNVREYIDASLCHFGDRVLKTSIDTRSISPFIDQVHLNELDRDVDRVIFCEGAEGRRNPWFSGVPWTPAKGEILTVRIPDLRERRIVNHGVWLAWKEGDLFRAGSTYDRDNLKPVPTESGREEIVRRLRMVLRRPFEIVDHVAAIRPIIDDRCPIVGWHPEHERIGILNGFGSKGSLTAPHFAQALVESLANQKAIGIESNVHRYTNR